ncbi:MAG: helix-turn-helix domain-containing protein [Candidatus Moranbacteria bacterium]|nr:helix-turn-helix domain-containing protein [Candidatus Moranbacteria bacterium]
MNSLIKGLQNVGLTQKESSVYTACLELGEGNIQQITDKSGVKRATVYDVVASLKQKGLLSVTRRKKKMYYYAEDPRAIEGMLDEKKTALKSILPELLAMANFLEKKPKIRYFEGNKGIEEVYKNTLQFPGTEMLAWGSEKAVEAFDSEFLNNFYVPTRVKQKIFVRAIATSNEVWKKYQPLDTAQLRKLKLIPEKQFPFAVEIDLYGDCYVAILSFEEKIALIIESEKIYSTLKSIFELQWGSLG